MNHTTSIANSVVSHECKVLDVKPLNSDTFQIELQPPERTKFNYQAGQYLQLNLDVNNDGNFILLSYSIANRFAPEQTRRLQLIIHNNSDFSAKVLNRLSETCKNNTTITAKLPLGQAYLQTDLNLPHILIAAGSGISKIKCLTEEILKQKAHANVWIYWSNKKPEDFYLIDHFKNWEEKYKNLRFTSILESDDARWSGRSGYIYEVIKEDFKVLSGTQAYLCGSAQMVYGTIDQLKALGLNETDCYSDVFEYAPRNQKIAI